MEPKIGDRIIIDTVKGIWRNYNGLVGTVVTIPSDSRPYYTVRFDSYFPAINSAIFAREIRLLTPLEEAML